jgi:hypothetical protein
VTDSGIYVYGISRGLPEDATQAMRGVGGAPVRGVAEGGLTALASTVSLADFGEDALRRNLEDLGWLEKAARAHHGVVDAAAAFAATVPLGLATVYRSEDRVREVLRERAEEFTGALDRITGRTEWGVKGYATLERPAPSEPAGEDAERPGTSYLMRRRTQQRTEQASRDEVMEFADRLDAELRGLAEDARLHPPQDPQLSGHEGWMIINAAYLVDDARAEEFRAAVASLDAERPEVTLQLTGPWAPYSFATEEEAWTG